MFVPSKLSKRSLTYITKEEEQNLTKKDSIPKEITVIFKILYYFLDENFNDETPANQLIGNFITSVFEKHKVNDIKSLITNYIDQNKDLKLNKVKYDNLENLFNSCPNIITAQEIAKINRPISYITFILKEIKQFINLKTKDNAYYCYDIKNKNEELNQIKKKIEEIENNKNKTKKIKINVMKKKEDKEEDVKKEIEKKEVVEKEIEKKEVVEKEVEKKDVVEKKEEIEKKEEKTEEDVEKKDAAEKIEEKKEDDKKEVVTIEEKKEEEKIEEKKEEKKDEEKKEKTNEEVNNQ